MAPDPTDQPPAANPVDLVRRLHAALRRYLAAGLPATPPAELRARDAACAACPDNALRGAGLTRWCAACKCYLHPKSRMATETCRHWPASSSLTAVTIDPSQARPCEGCDPPT